jgi:hypothetical protein
MTRRRKRKRGRRRRGKKRRTTSIRREMTRIMTTRAKRKTCVQSARKLTMTPVERDVEG